jgi:hypothetical protein
MRFQADSSTNQLLVSAAAEDFERIEAFIEKLESGAGLAWKTETYELKHARAAELVGVMGQMLADPSGRSRRRGPEGVRVAALSTANALVIQGPAEKHQLAAELLKKFDTEAVAAEGALHVIRLKAAQADAIARALSRMIPRRRGQEQTVFIQADRETNSILLKAPEAERQAIETMIADLEADAKVEREIRIVPLKTADASTVVPLLEELFPSPGGGRWRRGPSDDADRIVIRAAPDGKSLVVDAPSAKVAEIAAMA